MLMQENKILKFLGFMWNPLSWVMEAAAVMAIVLANGGVSRELNFRFSLESLPPTFTSILILFIHFLILLIQGEGPDWQDFVGIICLLVINSTISFIEENNAGNAASALMARLAPKTKVSFLGVVMTTIFPSIIK